MDPRVKREGDNRKEETLPFFDTEQADREKGIVPFFVLFFVPFFDPLRHARA